MAELFERRKWNRSTENVKEGDRVLIVRQGYGNEKTPLKYWPYGTVVQCKISKDGVVRVVKVETEKEKVEEHAMQNLVVIKRCNQN